MGLGLRRGRLNVGARGMAGLLMALLCVVMGRAQPPRPLTVAVNPEPSVYGQPYTLTANIVWPYSAAAGTVAFSIDGTPVGTSAVDDNFTASFVVTTAMITGDLNNPIYWVGAHDVTAVLLYNGGEQYAEATDTHTVVGQPTVSSIATLDQNIYYGQEIGYDFGVDAILMAAPADATYYGTLDGGTLNTYIGTTLVCSISYGVGGRCPDGPFAGYSVGTYQTYDVYEGNDYFAASMSPYYSVTVMQDNTATALASSANPSTFPQAVNLTATVTASYPGATATDVIPTVVGTVQFFDGATSIGTATLNAQGVATLPVATLLVGTHQLSACYVNSLNFMPSCSPVLSQVVTLPVTPENTVTLLTTSANPSIVGQAVAFTVTVETTGAIPQTPAGSVSLYDGATPLQTIMLNALPGGAGGIATLTTSSLTAGIHPITAIYTGNSATAGSTSAVLNQLVLTSLPQENGYLLVVTPTSLSVGVGGSVTVSVAVVGVNPAGQPFQLGCSLLPGESTCTFGQTTLPANGGTTTLTISTTAPHACGAPTPYFTVANAAGSKKTKSLPWLAFPGVLLVCMRRRTGRTRRLLLGLQLCAFVGSGSAPLTGCGGCTDVGTQPLKYSFLVNATAGGVASTNQYATISQAVTLNVHL
jgi:hypothetical protein